MLYEIAYEKKDVPILNFFMDLIHNKDKPLQSVIKSLKKAEVIFNET